MNYCTFHNIITDIFYADDIYNIHINLYLPARIFLLLLLLFIVLHFITT